MAGLSFLLLAIVCSVSTVAAADFGTYYKLFNAQSLWNSRPVDPIFSNDTIPLSKYYPTISSGAFSTGIFLAKSTDPSVIVYGRTSSGIINVDNFQYIPSITIPRWPGDSVPATGGDGHCDIVDEIAGIIHSFWILRQNNETLRWSAEQYAWSPLKGYGWGTPSHFYQGARAAGVPSSGGVIRIHEVRDGNPIYNHALAISLTYNGLAANPAFIYPATNADNTAATTNYGKFPEGALVMLPADYNTSRIVSADLKKVAETLKVFGAYIVDRNDGTPYAMYVENGSSFRMSNLSWDNPVADELQKIRANLKMVISAKHYLDGNNNILTEYKNVNLLSMRGGQSGWSSSAGDAQLTYDTWSQSVILSNSTKNSTWSNLSNLGVNQVKLWGQLQNGKNYTLFVSATGGATLQVVFQFNQTTAGRFVDVTLGDGQNHTFIYQSGSKLLMYARKFAGPEVRVRGQIMETDNIVPTSAPTNSPSSSPASSTSVSSPSSSPPSSSSSPSTASPIDSLGSTLTIPAISLFALIVFTLVL